MELTREVWEALSAPFPWDTIEFLPRAQSGGRALALPYIDARAVMTRLDTVVGPANWSFDYQPLSADGKLIKGILTVCGVQRADAGEADKEDEPLKSAVSDALKRCAVHFGIGRYLYHLPPIWAPFDSQKRRFSEEPRLSPAAVERALAVCGIGPAPVPPQPESSGDYAAQHQPPNHPAIDNSSGIADEARAKRMQGAFFAAFNERWPKTEGVLRHAILTVVTRRKFPNAAPVQSQQGWSAEKWQKAADIIKAIVPGPQADAVLNEARALLEAEANQAPHEVPPAFRN